jgi:hypothetical protein
MCPDDDLGASKAPIEMRRECVERLSHMPVPQIPGVHSALKHPPVILFGVSHEPGILLSREVIVLGNLSIPVKILISPLLQISELLSDFVLAGLRNVESGRVSVSLLILSKMIETRVSIASSPRCAGIDSF